MKRFLERNRKMIRFCTINATLSLIFLFISQTIYLFPAIDANVLLFSHFIKEKVIGRNEVPSFNDLLLINTSFENILVDNLDESGFPYGNVPITDRNKLKTLFERIEDSIGYKYILCDIFFDHASPDDAELKEILIEKPRYILPQRDSFDLIPKIFKDLNFGLGSIDKAGGIFYKYRLFNTETDTKSLPLKMYGEIHSGKSKSFWLWNILDNKIMPNDFIPYLGIRNYHLFETKEYPVMDIGELLSVSKENLPGYYKDRLIVIGDFYSDTHQGIYGDVQGPLILLNTYLSLKQGYNQISFLLILFLWVTFLAVSFVIKTPKDQLTTVLLKFPILNVIIIGVSYFLAVTILGVLVFLLFKVNLNFSYLGFLFIIENGYFNRTYYYKKFKNLILKKA